MYFIYLYDTILEEVIGQRVHLFIILVDHAKMYSRDIKPICTSTNLREYMLVAFLLLSIQLFIDIRVDS